MAWSDAARAAALQARRMHAAMWRAPYHAPANRKYGTLLAKPAKRIALAKELRSVRAGGGYSTIGLQWTVTDAVHSTHARNAFLRGRK